MNTVIDLMKSHSSVRRFKEEDIKEDDLQAILTAGQMAPLGRTSSLIPLS